MRQLMNRMVSARAIAAGAVAAGVCVGIGGGERSANASVPSYTLVGSFTTPSGLSWDIGPDGRVVGVLSDGQIVRQSMANGSTFAGIGAVDGSIFAGPFGNFGAGFVRVSPSGQTIAIGDNEAQGRVHFVQAASLASGTVSATTFITAPNFSAAWAGDNTLMVAGGFASSRVSRLNVGAGTATSVISGPDASGGVAIRGGRLFTGEGFSLGDPALTGNVRAFDLAGLLSATTATSFSTGTLVADALSGGSLGFDGAGNLLVGGGQSGGDFGYAAVIDAGAIAAAIAGSGPAPDASELRLSPAGSAFYGIRYNPVTDEVLVSSGGTVYRYAVPAPTGAAVLALGGVVAMRRRRGAASAGVTA